MVKKIFINLPVLDLNKTTEFFTALGFTFNKQFTNHVAACMILSENIFIMLLSNEFFKSFHKKETADTSKVTEVILAIDAESKAAVDQMIESAIKAGGSEPKPGQDHGWMYGRSFQDIDGHLWEVMFMDQTAIPEQAPQ